MVLKSRIGKQDNSLTTSVANAVGANTMLNSRLEVIIKLPPVLAEYSSKVAAHMHKLQGSDMGKARFEEFSSMCNDLNTLRASPACPLPRHFSEVVLAPVVSS